MIDAETVDQPFGEKSKQRRMGCLEHFLVLDAQRRELGDFKEAAPVDRIVRGLPRGEAIVLGLEQFVQMRARLGRWRVEVFEIARRGDRAAFGRKWKDVIEVLRLASVGVGVIGERYFSRLERLAIGPAEDGQEDLAAQLIVDRRPVDVEEFRVAARLPVLQHVPPPPILAADDGHVVGHDVDDEAEPAGAQRRDEAAKPLLAAKLRVDLRRVDHVIAVHRAWTRLENRRGVEMADMQRCEIGSLARRLVERKFLVELQPHGRTRRVCDGQGCGWRAHFAFSR